MNFKTLIMPIIITLFFLFIPLKEVYTAIKKKSFSSYLVVKIIYIAFLWLIMIFNFHNNKFTNYIISIPAVISILSIYLKEDEDYNRKEIINLTINIVSFSLFLFLSLKNNWNDKLQLILGMFLSYNFVKYFYLIFEVKFFNHIHWLSEQANKILKRKITFSFITKPNKETTLVSYKFQSHINGEYIIEASTHLPNKSYAISHIGKGGTIELACNDAKNNLLSIIPKEL